MKFAIDVADATKIKENTHISAFILNKISFYQKRFYIFCNVHHWISTD